MAIGYGVGYPILSVSTPAILMAGVSGASCLTLPDYARLVEYDECRFWGVRRQDDFLEYQCREMWNAAQRSTLDYYLAMATGMMEAELGFPLCPRWFSDELSDFGSRGYASLRHLIEPGIPAVADIADSAPVDHSKDTAQVGPIATAVTLPAEVRMFYPGTQTEIVPQEVQIADGEVTIYIPRCRMVRHDKLGQVEIAYEERSNFAPHVDVRRIYNDSTTHATVEVSSGHECGASLESTTKTAHMRILHKHTGVVQLTAATYSGGTWVRSVICGCAGTATLNYRAGLPSVPAILAMAVVRLAHTLMPEAPCGCNSVLRRWQDDRKDPPVYDRERLNCPFGTSDGAWFAWRIAQRNRVLRMGSI